MESKNPQIRDNADYQQTLWDHLFLMSHKQLDIDWPFDVSNAEKIHSKPQPIPIVKENGQTHMRHYGRLIMETFEKLKTMPEGAERDELVRLTANQMKRDLAAWGHGLNDNEKIADDLARFTDGKIQIDPSMFQFGPVGVPAGEGKRKKRK